MERAAMEEALSDVRDAMLKYTNVADPTENAARKERMRQAEDQGEFEEAAALIVQAAISANMDLNAQKIDETESPLPRIPSSQRLGPSPEILSQDGGVQIVDSNSLSPRIPIALRLSLPETALNSPLAIEGTSKPTTKRKPRRPPGRKNIQGSPKTVVGSSSKMRKV
ncbi:unnamed protein product [Eruca vesicaria subsp. sativa]|uniref:Uncharacterized protein n=1 Tax=Eruca vesicaria subsp. sativa TaxID=29727 RepID=A0ABC8J7Y6_ERUVS|nr:unnamed protein product [Eruca vesicaria subsp. sativa]